MTWTPERTDAALTRLMRIRTERVISECRECSTAQFAQIAHELRVRRVAFLVAAQT